MAAADWHRAEAIEALLNKGADPNLKDKEGLTALMMASGYDDGACVRALIAGHADLDVTDNRGETALTRAGDIGDVSMVALLKEAGAKRTDLHVIVKGPDAPGLTKAQAWALAVGAIYAQKNNYNPRVLGGNETMKNGRIRLKRDWKVIDTASLLKQLDDMRDHVSTRAVWTGVESAGNWNVRVSWIETYRVSAADFLDWFDKHIRPLGPLANTRLVFGFDS